MRFIDCTNDYDSMWVHNGKSVIICRNNQTSMETLKNIVNSYKTR
jgi:hypothetical protein